MGKSPAPAAPRGGEKPNSFCRLVLILIEHSKYKNAMEQSVMSFPSKPLWVIFCINLMGTNGILATGLPSNKLLSNPNTMNRTRATTAPDLNLNIDRSRLDSFKDVSTRSIFLVLDDFLRRFEEDEEFESVVFIVSSFLEALSMVDLRDLYEDVLYISTQDMASQSTAVHIDIPTTTSASEYFAPASSWAAIERDHNAGEPCDEAE